MACGAWAGCEGVCEGGGDGVLVWEADGLGDGSSTFTWEILPEEQYTTIHWHSPSCLSLHTLQYIIILLSAHPRTEQTSSQGTH